MEKLNIKQLGIVLVFILSSFSVSFGSQQLLMIRTAGPDFEEVKTSMAYELGEEFVITDFVIDKSVTPEMIAAQMNAVSPQVVVLMNNTAVSAYKKFQAGLAPDAAKVPSVSLMAILVNDAIAGLSNATGIGYEIPVVTSSVNLRSIFGAEKIQKIGIVHRAGFTPFIEQNRIFCKNENIALVTRVIGTENIESDLSKELKVLVDSGMSALWVPVDNKLINKELLMGVWIPFLQKNKLPVVVGVKNLVDPKFGFGTFAVLPDHSALGSQAASLVTDIMNNGWKVDVDGVTQPPLSVYTILNFPASNSLFGISRDDAEGAVDHLAE